MLLWDSLSLGKKTQWYPLESLAFIPCFVRYKSRLIQIKIKQQKQCALKLTPYIWCSCAAYTNVHSQNGMKRYQLAICDASSDSIMTDLWAAHCTDGYIKGLIAFSPLFAAFPSPNNLWNVRISTTDKQRMNFLTTVDCETIRPLLFVS